MHVAGAGAAGLAHLAEQIAGGDAGAGHDARLDRLEVGHVVAHAVVAEDGDGVAARAAGSSVARSYVFCCTSSTVPVTGASSGVPQPSDEKMSVAR